MRLYTAFTVILLVAAFAIACASSSDSNIPPVPTITPVLTHELAVIIQPTETAIVLLNPQPIGDREYVHGRTVTIDVLPQPGWEVDEWVGPVWGVAGRTAKIDMTISRSLIVSLVRSSGRLPVETSVSVERIAQPLYPPTSAGGTFEILVPPATSTSAATPIERRAEPVPCSAETRAAFIASKSFDSQGEYEKAIEKLNEVIRLDPLCATAYSSRGFARLHLGQNQQAIQDYDEAIRLAPEAGDLYYSLYNRGLVYSDLGQHPRGIQDLSEAIRLYPGQGWLYDGRATIYDRMGDTPKAIADRHQACDLNVDRVYCGATERPAPTAIPISPPRVTDGAPVALLSTLG